MSSSNPIDDAVQSIPAGLEREYRAIKSGAGIRHLDDRLIIRVSGDDRVSFLHGMCTADIASLRPGRVAPALFVTEHAHIIAESLVYALDDQLLIEIDCDVWPRVRAHLDKFLVADDVEFDELASMGVVDFEGPDAAALVTESCGLAPPPEAWSLAPQGMTARIPRFGSPAITVVAEAAAMTDLLTRLAAAQKLGHEVLEIIRIEHGRARVGIDTTDKTLALEARLEHAISLTKGCYIGQETLERATARGAIKRRLCGLRIAGTRAPQAGSAILADEKPVGTLTSIAESPALGLIGLSILHHSVWPAGTRVTVREGTSTFPAETAELPLVDS
jgi:folate-binding protein YgfZ